MKHAEILRLNHILQIFSLFALIMVCAVAFGMLNAHAQPPFPEYQVKAAFIFNFVKFVEWPTESPTNATIIVGVLGKDPFGTAIDSIQGKTAKGRKLLIRRFKYVQDIENCHILFISASEKKHLAEIVEALSRLSILTVGDTEGAAQQGVIINFYTKQKKVLFEINVEAAERAKLKISSKLLKLAKIVHKVSRREDG